MNTKIIIFILSALLFSCNRKEEVAQSESISEDIDTIKPITQKFFTDVIPTHFTDGAKIEAFGE
ncbi:hypothetical protein [Brumimicrobium glaciale]|nr:hypothetical protein [Brumimicrobium glaciale]